MNDIIDIKDIHFVDLTWIFVLLLSVLGILILSLLYSFFKKWKKKQAPELKLTPIERALHKLDHLVEKGISNLGEVQPFYFELSNIFRNFLEEELGIPAIEATLPELKTMLPPSIYLSTKEVQEAHWLLELCDSAKFAKFVPPKEELVHSVKTCRILMNRIAEKRREEVIMNQPALGAS